VGSKLYLTGSDTGFCCICVIREVRREVFSMLHVKSTSKLTNTKRRSPPYTPTMTCDCTEYLLLKVTVTFSLFQQLSHIGGSMGVAPYFLNLGTLCRLVVKFTPQSLCYRGKITISHKVGWASEPFEKSKSLSLPRIEPRII
jgi:hypothetical protein